MLNLPPPTVKLILKLGNVPNATLVICSTPPPSSVTKEESTTASPTTSTRTALLVKAISISPENPPQPFANLDSGKIVKLTTEKAITAKNASQTHSLLKSTPYPNMVPALPTLSQTVKKKMPLKMSVSTASKMSAILTLAMETNVSSTLNNSARPTALQKINASLLVTLIDISAQPPSNVNSTLSLIVRGPTAPPQINALTVKTTSISITESACHLPQLTVLISTQPLTNVILATLITGKIPAKNASSTPPSTVKKRPPTLTNAKLVSIFTTWKPMSANPTLPSNAKPTAIPKTNAPLVLLASISKSMAATKLANPTDPNTAPSNQKPPTNVSLVSPTSTSTPPNNARKSPTAPARLLFLTAIIAPLAVPTNTSTHPPKNAWPTP